MNKKRILVVDDEVSFSRIVKLNLEDTGRYIVRTEDKGKNAPAVAREFKPDLILLDIVMPDADGGEIAHLIKEDKELCHIPVVFLTALVKDNELESHGKVIGGHSFIAKPVTTEKLISCIEECTDKTA